jgi:hypothetical protein
MTATIAQRLFPLVEREDLIQVAREALVRPPRRLHEQGQCPVGHLNLSLDARADGELCASASSRAPQVSRGEGHVAGVIGTSGFGISPAMA